MQKKLNIEELQEMTENNMKQLQEIQKILGHTDVEETMKAYENVSEQFIQVIQNKTTEQLISESNQEYFTNMFTDFGLLSENKKNSQNFFNIDIK